MTDHAELNGQPVEAVPIKLLRATTYGHFSSMQVRDRSVRGLDLHLERLDRSTREMFGHGLDGSRVSDYLSHAVQDLRDASVRVTVFGDADVLIHVTDPAEPRPSPVRLRSVEYERDLPHLKHNSTLGLTYHARQAEQAGYDDALFHDRHGEVSEASIWNICLVTGDTVVWPSAPALPGITMLLVQAGLGGRSQHRPVSLTDLGGFEAAYLTNSANAALPVASIDELRYADRPDLRSQVLAAYESNPWDPL